MKQIIRAAGIGFGATLGAGAALVFGGALVSMLARSALKRTVEEGFDKITDYLDRQQPDEVDPCGQTFPGGQGYCVRPDAHEGPHASITKEQI